METLSDRASEQQSHAMWSFADDRIWIDVVNEELYVDAQPAELSPVQFAVLARVAMHVGQYSTPDEITIDIWGRNDRATAEHLYVTVSRTRNVIGDLGGAELGDKQTGAIRSWRDEGFMVVDSLQGSAHLWNEDEHKIAHLLPGLSVNYTTMQMRFNDQFVHLNPTELRLVQQLSRRPPDGLSIEELSCVLPDPKGRVGKEDIIRAAAYRIHKKLRTFTGDPSTKIIVSHEQRFSLIDRWPEDIDSDANLSTGAQVF